MPSPVWSLPACLDSQTTGCCFYFGSLFILSGVISPLISSSLLGTYPVGEFIFQCPIFLPFHTVHGVLKAWVLQWFAIPFSSGPHFVFSYCSWGSQGRNTEVVCHFLLQWTTFCQTSPPWPAHLGRPHMAWLSFIELDKAVVHVIRLSSFLWLWFQCVCLLMPLATTTGPRRSTPAATDCTEAWPFRYDLNQIP